MNPVNFLQSCQKYKNLTFCTLYFTELNAVIITIIKSE